MKKQNKKKTGKKVKSLSCATDKKIRNLVRDFLRKQSCIYCGQEFLPTRILDDYCPQCQEKHFGKETIEEES